MARRAKCDCARGQALLYVCAVMKLPSLAIIAALMSLPLFSNADSAAEKGAAFLKENASKEGVKTTPSGLQYKILTEGTGPKPAATDSVTCNYRGTLINSTEFDSSSKRGQPATFQVNGVIKGWTEALQLMPVGSKWQLFVPAELGYGDRGSGPQIGPGATLIFEVELLSIGSKDKQPEAAPTAKP